MEWIFHSYVVGLYLSEKDSASNPSGMTQVFVCVKTGSTIGICNGCHVEHRRVILWMLRSVHFGMHTLISVRMKNDYVCALKGKDTHSTLITPA